MKNRNLLTIFGALALAASACTLPADDAGEMPGDEKPDGPERLAAGSEAIEAVEAVEPNDAKQAHEEPDQGLIVCRLRVDYPHKSGHAPGNVNVQARTTCTSAVEGIQMQVTLVRDGLTVASRSDSSSGRSWLETNASAGCVDGVYQGRAWATIYFPPGHTPSPQTLSETSPSIPIECGIRAVAPWSLH